MSDVVVKQSLDYKKREVSGSRYRLLKVLQQAGGQTVTIGTSTQESVFEIPAKVFNCDKSILSFNQAFTAGGGTKVNWLYTHPFCPQVRTVKAMTRSGVTLFEIVNANVYHRVIGLPEMSLEKFLSNGELHGVGDLNPITGVMRHGVSVRNGNSAAATANSELPTAVSTGATAAVENFPSYTGVMHCFPGAANAANPSTAYQIPLSNLCKNTVFGLDKDLWFAGEIINLYITWESYTRVGILGVSTAAPASTATAAAAIAADVSITHLALYLACNNDPMVRNELEAKVNGGGLNLLVPYVHYNKQNFGATGSQNVTLRIDRSLGHRLSRIYHSVFNTTENSSTAYDNNNLTIADVVDGKVTSYYTQLNNERLQDINIDTSTFEDWLFHKDKLSGSAIQNPTMYKHCWFHCDDFRDGDVKLWEEDQNDDSGLPIVDNVKWDFVGDCATTSNHYSYVITKRNLLIRKDMIAYV